MYAYIFLNKIPAIMKALTINEFKIKFYELYLEIYDRYVRSKLSYVTVHKRIIHSKAFKANLHLPAFSWKKKSNFSKSVWFGWHLFSHLFLYLYFAFDAFGRKDGERNSNDVLH